MDGGDGAGRPVPGGASLLQYVQFVLKVGVAELGLFQIDVGEAEGGSGAQAGGGQGPSTGGQRATAAARGTRQRAC